MYGAIIGDILGSTFEFEELKNKNFPLFASGSEITDDTIMTVAVARALMQWRQEGGDLEDHMIRSMQSLGRKYPNPLGAYGFRFFNWIWDPFPMPYNSCGNGSAMRASPCGLLASTLEEALAFAEASSVVSHDHPEGIKGAQATAAAVFLAKTGHSRQQIREYIHQNFYPMDRTMEQIRAVYEFDATCQGTVPEGIIAFLESETFEDAVRNSISLGGDADTIGAITGSIAWSFYRAQNSGGLTEDMLRLRKRAEEYMPDEFIATAAEFDRLCWKQ